MSTKSKPTMKGGDARRKTLSSDRPTPPPPPRNDLVFPNGGGRCEDQSSDQGVVNGEAELVEGTYEVESVQRKRKLKGKMTYLIKWRGWPESSNTWEPMENLMGCSDLIDAFEARNTTRKKKRKHAHGLQQQRAKKIKEQLSPSSSQHQQESPAATYHVPIVKVEEPLPNTFVNDPTCSKWAESNAKGVRKMKCSSENRSLLVSQESMELNLKLSEVKGASLSSAKGNIDGVAVNIQEDRFGERVSPSDGISTSNVNGQNFIWANRNGEAETRKSSAVKRFIKDLDLATSIDVHDARDRLVSGNGDHRDQSFDKAGNCYGSMNVVDTSKSMYAITKIIKPIKYNVSTLNDMEDVLITFLVIRSNGKKIMVDNRYLAAHNPLLLIDFYEKHISLSDENSDALQASTK